MQFQRFKKSLALGLAALMAVGSITMTPATEIQAAAKAPTKITLNAAKKSVEVGKKFTLKVKSVTPKTASKKVTFKSNNKKVATVTNKGVVTGVRAGKAKITVTSTAKKSVKAVCNVTVTAPKAKSIVVKNAVDKTLVVDVKKTITVKPSVLPEGAKVSGYTYSIKNKKTATIDKKGKLKGVKAGKTTLTIKSKKTAGIKTLSLKLNVIVPSVPVTGVTLNHSELNLEIGGNASLTPAVAPGNATSKLVSWSSSKESVATVDAKGNVKAVAAGTAVITVQTLDNAKKATCKVTVTEKSGSVTPDIIPVQSVTVTPAAASVEVGKTVALTAVVLPENATDKTVTWSSDQAAVAEVAANGVVTAKAAGTAVITAKAGDKTAAATITVTASVPTDPEKPTDPVAVESVQLAPESATAEVGKTVTLTASVLPENATDKTVTWTSDNEAVATVADGVVTAVSVGTATITATAGGKSATASITVVEAGTLVEVESVALDKTSAKLTKAGQTVKLTATVLPENATDKTVAWTSDNEAVATVADGVVTAVAEGKATITAAAGGKTAAAEITVEFAPAVDPDSIKHDDYYYWQTFAGITDATTVATSANAPDQLKILNDTEHSNYLSFDFSETNANARGAVMDFAAVDVSAQEKYIVEFDAAVKPGSNQNTQLVVKGAGFTYAGGTMNDGAGTNYLLKLDNGKGDSTEYTLNDVVSVTIPSAEWCHYKLFVDKTQKLMSVTITGLSGVILDKHIVSYNGDGNVAGLYMRAGRYKPVESVDNIAVRAVEDTDEFGELPEETLVSAAFTSSLNRTIAQPAEGEPEHLPITVKANGSLGNDLSDKVTVKWTTVGLDNEDGYISLTKEAGTGEGTDGVPADGTTAYFNVRNGVSNWIGYVQAEVAYGEDQFTIRTPFAVLGAGNQKETQLAPQAGYPVNMNDYKDSLVGYEATANGIKDKDIVLNGWSIYGSNGARTLKLVKEEDGTKSLEFASNGGGGSTVGVYQWADQTDQYVIDFTAKFPAGMGFGVYANTPNNGNNSPEWTASVGSGALTAGTQTISGIDASAWNRYVVSADPSINKYTITVYGPDGEKIGETEEIDMTNPDASQVYFCFMGTWPMYLNSFEAYKPVVSSISIASDAEVIKVPDAETDPASTMDLTANLTSETGVKVTGEVNWSLSDEYAGVELVSTGTQTAQLKVSAGAAGTVTVVAAKDGKTAEKEILLTTSANVVAFTKSVSSIDIPFEGEESKVCEFKAETRNKDGLVITPDEAIEYTLLAKDGVTETTVKGVTLAEDGKLTVAAGASPAIVYVKATNVEKLSNKVKVNIHGLSFAFGTGDPQEGYTQVTADSQYTEKLGYGFTNTTGLTAGEDNVTSTNKYQFKADVPNGNYLVTLDTTSAEIKSEIVDGIPASTGITKKGGSFSVAVCDGVLDLTFDASSVLKSLTITQMAKKVAQAKPSVYAIGDSTTNNTASGAKSWGNCVADKDVALPASFGAFSNNGMAGRDSVNYYNEGRVETVLLAVCPGDYVTVNMGINSKEAGEPGSYMTLLEKYYVDGIIQRGGIPVILTATPIGFSDRVNSYDAATGKFTTNRGDGAAHNADLKKIATDKGLSVIDVGAWGQNWMNSLTMDDVNAYNAANSTEFTSVLDMVKSWYPDHNHYTQYLGVQIGTYILGELEKIHSESSGAN